MRLYEITNELLHRRVFEFLRGNGIVKNGAIYSTDYMDMSRGYLNVLLNTNAEPSRKAYRNLKWKLEEIIAGPYQEETKSEIEKFIYEIDKRLNKNETAS
ncbi:DUF6626 family protein [Magnetovibrio blakemorei]|uniref:Uncharacterized protein n=1 Tax=Magnetovibrio blakemorei TaxID=28181 RepID=A0A1E5Q996_9PROT|nr:DUF6626 family protein [Magnetovibrio blakemorei]OEJ67628.1 hypothetical protein BEN30_09415 [Magnetovibrio blakemorei]